jgi:NitT/TauT family transport system substrate-binding protein
VAYVGLDPRTDINYAWVKKDEAMELFKKGKIDAFMSFPPGPQELMAKNIGHLLVDTNVDKPWSQYFCCMITGQSDFVKNNPIATKRALRAILKANDIVARDPEYTLRVLQQKKIWKKSETKYILQALKEIPYGKWREYNPEETIRFNALRLHDVGIIKTPPDEFIARYTDWSFLRSMKDELGLMW